jgi:hypothetical protein
VVTATATAFPDPVSVSVAEAEAEATGSSAGLSESSSLMDVSAVRGRLVSISPFSSTPLLSDFLLHFRDGAIVTLLFCAIYTIFDFFCDFLHYAQLSEFAIIFFLRLFFI